MARQETTAKKLPAPASSTADLDDEAILQEGNRALKERQGTVGMVRYLRLVAPAQDRFEEIREEWVGSGMDEALRKMGFPRER